MNPTERARIELLSRALIALDRATSDVQAALALDVSPSIATHDGSVRDPDVLPFTASCQDEPPSKPAA